MRMPREKLRATMDVVEVGRTDREVPVYLDRHVWESDGVVVVNRVKAHTAFKASIESGLCKMLAVGLGKQRGAETMHRAGLARTIPEAAAVSLASGKVLLGVAIVTLFVIVYAFYDQGLPGVEGSSRLEAAREEQYLETVKRGYNLFEANCARCHGAQGQGGIGPVLNDQGKLLAHLTPAYLKNVLTVGGRYVCGDANSLMGVWADTNGGPLNYREIEELIAWIRASTTDEIEVRDPETGELVKVNGWRDPAYVPAADATPVPACWKDAFAVSPTPMPSSCAVASVLRTTTSRAKPSLPSLSTMILIAPASTTSTA